MLIPVILAGGAGTRLWPVSREGHPKPFMKPADGQRLLHKTYLPAGQRHRLENPGMLELVMIEVQSGEYLGEDDIVRFEDDYGRAQMSSLAYSGATKK